MLSIVLLMCFVLFNSKAHHIPDFNFTISSNHNRTGHWYAQVQLGHGGGQQPWDVYVNHTTMKWNDTEAIVIDAKIITPLKDTNSSLPFDETSLISLGYQILPELGYYKVHLNKKSWEEAVQVCQQEGTHLLIINSQQEAHQVGSFMLNNSIQFPWVGIHDRYKEGVWMTIFNKSLSSTGFMNWGSTNPNGGTKQNCVYFYYRSKTNYGLDDFHCTDKDMFICEQET